MHPGLEICDLRVSYGATRALENMELSVAAGQSLALVGGNGAGKSTLLKAIAGLLPIDSGSITWEGKAISHRTGVIAYLPQRESVDWNFPVTVRGLVEMGCYPRVGLLRPFDADNDAIVERAVATMQLEDVQNRQLSELSGGQQQRAFIARSLAQEARILLLDEPFSGLDKTSQDVLADQMGSLVAEKDCLIIASHHDLHSVASIFDSALLLMREPVALGPPSEVMTESNIEKAFSS